MEGHCEVAKYLLGISKSENYPPKLLRSTTDEMANKKNKRIIYKTLYKHKCAVVSSFTSDNTN